MARIRSIKHELFLDEELAKLDLRARYTFPGLWTLADREGRLEDRPARIRAELFPYEPKVDMEATLSTLAEAGFIQRYEVDGRRCIQVVNFLKHQRPNVREVASELPAFDDAAAPQVGRSESTYVIRNPATNMLKVGRAMDVDARVNDLSNASGVSLEVLVTIPGGHHEHVIHSQFASLRQRGEWFSHSDDLLGFARGLAAANLDLHDRASVKIRVGGNGSGEGKGMENGNGVSSELAGVGDSKQPPLMVFPVVGGKRTWGLYSAEFDRLLSAFPDLDIAAEARKSLAWLEANRTRLKTPKGMSAFLFGWMQRTQNDTRGKPPGIRPSPPTDTRCEHHRKRGTQGTHAPKPQFRNECPECRHVSAVARPRGSSEASTAGDLLANLGGGGQK